MSSVPHQQSHCRLFLDTPTYEQVLKLVEGDESRAVNSEKFRCCLEKAADTLQSCSGLLRSDDFSAYHQLDMAYYACCDELAEFPFIYLHQQAVELEGTSEKEIRIVQQQLKQNKQPTDEQIREVDAKYVKVKSIMMALQSKVNSIRERVEPHPKVIDINQEMQVNNAFHGFGSSWLLFRTARFINHDREYPISDVFANYRSSLLKYLECVAKASVTDEVFAYFAKHLLHQYHAMYCQVIQRFSAINGGRLLHKFNTIVLFQPLSYQNDIKFAKKCIDDWMENKTSSSGCMPVRSCEYLINKMNYTTDRQLRLVFNEEKFLNVSDFMDVFSSLKCFLDSEILNNLTSIHFFQLIRRLRDNENTIVDFNYGKHLSFQLNCADFYVTSTTDTSMGISYDSLQQNIRDDADFTEDVRSLLSTKSDAISQESVFVDVPDIRSNKNYLTNGALALAKFISEPCRNITTWTINLMLLDLMENNLLMVGTSSLNWKSFIDVHPMKGGSDQKDNKSKMNEVLYYEALIGMYWTATFWPYSRKPYIDKTTFSTTSRLLVEDLRAEVIKLFYRRSHDIKLWKPSRDEDAFSNRWGARSENNLENVLKKCQESRLAETSEENSYFLTGCHHYDIDAITK
jgi:hypothetical protein